MKLFQCNKGDIVQWEDGGELFCIDCRGTDRLGFLYDVCIRTLSGAIQHYRKHQDVKFLANVINLTDVDADAKKRWDKQAEKIRREDEQEGNKTGRMGPDYGTEQWNVQVAIIKSRISAVKNEISDGNDILNQVLMMFITDSTYSRSAICHAEKEWRKQHDIT